MHPRREGRITTILTKPLEGTNEGLLREILRQVRVAGQSERESIDAVDVRVVQRSLRRAVASETSGHELQIGHDVATLAGAVL